MGAFNAEKIAFLPYSAIEDFLYSGDFNWKKITPSDHTSEAFAKMLNYTKDIFKEKCQIFDYSKRNEDLKSFIKNSVAKGKHNPVIIDTDNFYDCYLKWSVEVLPTIRLGEEWQRARNANIALESELFLADLISEDNESYNENLRILLQKTKQNKLYFEIKKSKDELFENEFNIIKIDFIDEATHTHFWNFYKRPPAEKFWSEIVNRRDKITPRDIMERKGAYFTPEIWVKKAQDYLAQTLGKQWQDEYYIWDCAAGTGNLLKGLTNSGKIFASTLDLSDVLIMKCLIKLDKDESKIPKKQKLNLLENNVF